MSDRLVMDDRNDILMAKRNPPLPVWRFFPHVTEKLNFFNNDGADEGTVESLNFVRQGHYKKFTFSDAVEVGHDLDEIAIEAHEDVVKLPDFFDGVSHRKYGPDDGGRAQRFMDIH